MDGVAINVFIADDDTMVLDGLAMVLEQSGEFRVGHKARNARALLRALEGAQPDVVLLDIRMPEENGLECCREIKLRWPNLPVLMLSTFHDDEYLKDALRYGAHGYLLKHQTPEALMLAIRSAVNGTFSFEPGVARSLAVDAAQEKEQTFHGLTEREQAVLRLVAEGRSNREISDQLFLSEGTVRNYVSTLLQFAGVRDRTQLVIWYFQNGKPGAGV